MKGDLAMTSMIVEAVLVAFCVGGAVGAIITMQLLLGNAKKAEEAQVAHRRIK